MLLIDCCTLYSWILAVFPLFCHEFCGYFNEAPVARGEETGLHYKIRKWTIELWLLRSVMYCLWMKFQTQQVSGNDLNNKHRQGTKYTSYTQVLLSKNFLLTRKQKYPGIPLHLSSIALIENLTLKKKIPHPKIVSSFSTRYMTLHFKKRSRALSI
jgi:hypothetical protein